MKLAIIGTAGRGEDGEKLRKEPAYWNTMCAVAQIMTTVLRPDCVVSGGAAYGDHVAVWLYLEGLVPNLTLHLPCDWTGKGFKSTFQANNTGGIANHYHSLFSRAQGFDSLAQIQQAITRGATACVNSGGFKARNSDVANDGGALLAFTFGQGAKVKDGGTSDTVGKFLSKRILEQTKLYTANMNGANYCPIPFPAYHFCLNDKRLYAL